ncbi:hypothetical protein Pelo_10359 [Pelomyxa schiedti]|nr:hypothetical protein Pelo_10359 [Pelomyxa schiedti]
MQASSCTFKEEDEEEDITIAPQPAQLVPVRDDWFYCEEGLKFQCRTTLEFLGLRDQDVSCTLEKVSVGDSVSWAAKISLLQQFSAPHDEIHGAGSSSDQVDGGTCSQQMWKVPPQEEREKKKPGTEGEGPKRKKAKGDPFASVLVSKTGAKLTCKGASLRKIFEHIGHAFPREALVGVKKLFKKIAEAEIQVSLDADIQFGSPPEIQIELFKVSFGEWLHLKMATKMVNDSNQSAVDQSSFPIPQGSRPLLSHPPTTSVVTKSGSRSLLCFKGKIRVRMGQVVKFMDEILGLHTVADVLQRVTQTEILKLPEATLFHMNIELEVSGGQGLNVKHLTISVKGIHLFGIPLDMESGFDLGDSNPHLFLHLRKPTMLKTIGEKPDANSISLLDILHELGIFEDRNGDTQEILKKIVLRDYTLLLQLQKVKDSSAQSLLSSSFAFSLCVSIKGLSEVIDCKACLLHHMSRTCAMLEFSNLSLSRIVSVLFGTSLPSLPIDVSPERFEWLHGAKPQITDDGTEITNLVSSCTDGARHLFLREENSFLCLAVSISLTGQLFEWIGLTGEPFKADFVVADSSAYMMVALKKFELPCAGLKAGTCTLRIDVNPLSISLKTCLLFAHDLKLRASLKGLLIPPSLTASLKLDGNRETGIPLSLFIPKLKHLAVYGIRGALSISAPLTISFMFGGAIRALWDDGPKPAFEALLRVSLIAGQPTISTIYLFCKEVTLGSIVRLFTGCSYKDVETLDHAFPQVKELGLLIKLDREELTSIPSMEIKPAQNQNSLLSIIQQSTGRKGIPLLQRENMFLGFVAQMSWLGLDAKILFCSLANTIDFTSPSLLLKLQLLIQEWTCKVGSTVLFILGGSNKELSVDLTVNTGTREVAFLFDAKVSILPKSLGLTIGTKIGFERRQGQGPSLNVAVRLSLSREDPQSEDNAIEVTRAEEQNNKIELSGSLKVTWTKIVPNIRAELGIRNLNAAMVVSAIVGGLRYCIGKIFKVCKKALQRAQRRVSKWAPGFVKWLIVGAIQMASFVADAVGGEFLDSLLTRLKTLCEGVLVVNNLQVMGEVTSDDKSVVVMVKIDISLFGHELQGSMNVNLKTLIIDICKKLLQFVLKWKKNGNKPDDVDSDNSIFFAEENEQPLIKCSTKDGSTNMLDTLVPSAFTLPDQEMKDPAREEIRSLVNDVSRKFDLRHTISPEEAFALTTTDLSDPWLSDVPYVPPFIFSRHVKLCALRTTVECTQCNEQVRVVDQERHMAETARDTGNAQTAYVQYREKTNVNTSLGNPHVCSAERFCLICRNTFDTCTNHFCDPLEKCKHCASLIPTEVMANHLDSDCTAVPITCADCNCTLPPTPRSAREKKSEHVAQCTNPRVMCHNCLQLFQLDTMSDHKLKCEQRPTNNPPDCSLASTTFGNNLQNLIPMERKHLVGMGKLRKLAIIKLISEELTQHEEGVNMAQCQFCYESMPAHLLDDHLKFECPKYVQPCPQQCGYTGVMRYMFEHITGQCYLSKGLCIYNPGCTQPVHFRVSYDEARLLYPNQPSIEMYNTGVYHTVKNLYTSAKDRTDCGESYAEGALYTALCSKMKEEKKAFHLQKRDETRHAIFCPERELCIFCRDHVRDLSRHIPYCPFRRIPIPCIYCSDGIRIDEMVRHWLYECRGEHFFIECPNCNIRLPYRDLDIHLLSGCARSIIVCPYCKQQLPVTEYSSHLLMKCDRSCVSVTCGFCSKLCTSKELLQGSHYATQCRLCSWSCPLGAAEEREILATSASIPKSASFCCKKVPICGLEEHLIPDAGKAICISYKVSCRYKLCPVKFLRRDLTHHMEHACEENKVTCEFCGIWNGPKKRYTEHTKECPKRMSTCKRCQKEISLPEEENHLANECGQSGKDCKCGQKVPLSSWNHHRLYTCQKRTVTAHSSLLYHHALKAVPHQMVLGPHITTNEHWGKKKRDAENTALAAFTLGISTIFTSPFIYTCCGLNVKSPICTSCPLCHGPCAKGRCPRAPGQCSRCGKTLTMEQARSEVCMETCAVCNVPQSEWESTRCTPGICSICRQPPKVGEGCHDAPLDQVPWKVREMGYYKNKLNT